MTTPQTVADALRKLADLILDGSVEVVHYGVAAQSMVTLDGCKVPTGVLTYTIRTRTSQHTGEAP